MSNSIVIDTSKNEHGEISALLTRDDGQIFRLYYQVGDGGPIHFDGSADAFAIASAQFFMKVGGDISVAAPLSRRVLIGLTEWAGAFHNYFPWRYKRVRFLPTNIIGGFASPDTNRGIAAFSGGVDANFTLTRHQKKALGESSVDIEDAVLVHGFDIPLEDTGAFARAAKSTRETLNKFGLPLTTLKTNFRSMPGQSWHDAHGAGLVAALHLVAPSARIALIGSSYTYAEPLLGWGSAPELDHLLSSNKIEVRHDGADFTRSQKIEYVAKFEEVVSELRVCFQSIGAGRNCGNCEKCWRTRIALAIFGVEFPKSFPRTPLESLKLPNLTSGALLFWNDLAITAEKKKNKRIQSIINNEIDRVAKNKTIN